MKEEPDLRPALLMTRFIRLHLGAQKGETVIWEGAVRTVSQAKPLCQPESNSGSFCKRVETMSFARYQPAGEKGCVS